MAFLICLEDKISVFCINTKHESRSQVKYFLCADVHENLNNETISKSCLPMTVRLTLLLRVCATLKSTLHR